MTAFTFRDLEVWQLGMDLVERCYRVTARLPASEQYGLTGQIRRAAVSIPSNVAEGHCRRTTGAFAHHVSIALGSQGELETCIEIACRLGYISPELKSDLLPAAASVGRLLNALHSSLERKLAEGARAGWRADGRRQREEVVEGTPARRSPADPDP